MRTLQKGGPGALLYGSGAALILLGLLAIPARSFGWLALPPGVLAAYLLGLPAIGAGLLFASRSLFRAPGIDNDQVANRSATARGVVGYLLGMLLTGFYVVIYFGPSIHLSGGGTLADFFARHVYSIFEPISQTVRGRPADNWFTYSLLYTFAVLLFGLRFLLKYRHNRYQQLRTASVMLFQLGFGFMIPSLLVLFQQPEHYFSYFWPLKPEYLYPSYWARAVGPGLYFLGFGVLMTVVATPVLTFFYGKRWYCSWVCGCGGLAETMGDPFRQLSSKSLVSWRVERWMIHSVLAAVSVVTLTLWLNSVLGGRVLGRFSAGAAKAYGFYIGMIFSGVVGVGFYPIFGSRVWCRFGCPMAAGLGMLQKWFSRFRITTNGGQCISCGNCSTYCEMGIDVRWYAQRQQNIVRASCVGCGICAAVCPRGVLRLENGPADGRTEDWHLNDLVAGRVVIGPTGH